MGSEDEPPGVEVGAVAGPGAGTAWWRRRVPSALAQGCALDRWREERGEAVLEAGGVLSLDPCGFFLVWRVPERSAEVFDLCFVSDVYFGGNPKDIKLVSQLVRHGDAVPDKTLTIVTGSDLVNLTHHNFVFPSPELARVWLDGLRKITHNHKLGHLSVQTNILKQWTGLQLSVDARGRLPLRVVVDHLAQAPMGRPDRPDGPGTRTERQEQAANALADLGFHRSQVKSIEPSSLTLEKFEALYRAVCPRPDIDDLYSKICGEEASGAGEGISAERLRAFLNERQRDQRLNEILRPLYSTKRTLELIAAHEPHQHARKAGRMTKDGFFRYLTSDETAPVTLDRLDVYMDMTQPLSHYFINSSHNTYLTGRQFGGKSSVEMYRQVLLAGCRCVELDCWDGDRGEPIITHGRAMCTDILLRDVLVAIADAAFAASNWPVVLSVENHCSKAQQQRMAQLMEECLGPLLLKEPLPDHPLEPGEFLPSPAALRRKILVKNKRLKPEVERIQLELFRKGQLEMEDDEDENDPQVPSDGTAEGEEVSEETNGTKDSGTTESLKEDAVPESPEKNDTTEGGKSQSPESQPQQVHPDLRCSSSVPLPGSSVSSAVSHVGLTLQLSTPLLKKQSLGAVSSSSTPSSGGATTGGGAFAMTPEDDEQPPYIHVGSTTKVHPWLSSLINYVESVKFPGFDIAQQRNMHYHMSSFAETHGLNLINRNAIELVNYNKRQVTRIYPRGTRADSSNFIPQMFWNGGCQMVSLNFQTPDLPMQLNQGKFEHNGNIGYLLKPDILRRADRNFDPFTESPVDGVIAAQCSVQVISGQFLSERPVGTYVEVDMYGLNTDTIRREFRTRTVPSNGLNPVYNEEPFLFRKVVLPELALLRLAVYDEGGRPLGQRVLPLDGLQPGYRHVPLRSEANLPLIYAQLFCYFEIKIYVPAGYEALTAALLDPRGHRLGKETATGGGAGADAEVADRGSTLSPPGAGNVRREHSSLAAGPLGDSRLKKGEEPWPFASVELAPLRALPSFRRMQQGHCAEVQRLRVKQHKELLREGRRQSEEVERLAQRKDPLSLASDGEIRLMVRAQSALWSTLRAQHRRAEWQLVREHLSTQRALLLRLQEEAHQRQRKELDRMHDRQKRDLTAQQAKASVEAMRALSQEEDEVPSGAGSVNGAGAGEGSTFGRRSRTERKRRMRERKQSNTRVFLEEMRVLMAQQCKTLARLHQQHAQARDALCRELQRVYELYCNEEREQSLQPKIETYV